MGHIATYKCGSCGYQTERLTVGGTMRSEPSQEHVLVRCLACATLVAVKRKFVSAGCATHAADYVIENNQDNPACPRCAKPLDCDTEIFFD